MTRSSKIPETQRGLGDRAGQNSGNGARSEPSGEADIKPETQGRFGDLRQTLINHWQVHQR